MPLIARPAQTRPVPSLHRVRARIGISQETLAQILGVSVRTVGRWEAKSSFPSRLAQDRMDRLTEVLQLAEQIFAESAIASWFQTPNPTLRGRTPLGALTSRGGLDEVYHLLGRMAWGIPT
ncbi:MAG: DUF2384 domain-containing protein [candidate division NC10 bacterium]|nr:DUF2384 domain-containing protein [candidate division NC10 bacterium]MBI4841499.1 DUF2384 domain-containing protein [candidate division NC10 bacterium]